MIPQNSCFTYVQCIAGMPECSWWQPTSWGGGQESCRPAFKAPCHHWQWEQASPQDGSLCWTSGSVAGCWASHLLTRSSDAQGIIKCVMKQQSGCPCLARHCVAEHGNCSPHMIDDVANSNARATQIYLQYLNCFPVLRLSRNHTRSTPSGMTSLIE